MSLCKGNGLPSVYPRSPIKEGMVTTPHGVDLSFLSGSLMYCRAMTGKGGGVCDTFGFCLQHHADSELTCRFRSGLLSRSLLMGV